MQKTALKWIRCKDGDRKDWCPLETVNLTNVICMGVYIIWHDGTTFPPDYKSQVVRVGEGDVPDRIRKHRTDDEITLCGAFGALKVTWAPVTGGRERRRRIERHLAERWNPLVGQYPTDVEPLAVNSPWD